MSPAELHALNAVLPRGARNATSVPALARALGWTDRQVREAMEQLVCEGLQPQAKDPKRVPIVTRPTNQGVFVAVTPKELEEAIEGLRGRGMAILRRARGLRLCREQVAYTSTLF